MVSAKQDICHLSVEKHVPPRAGKLAERYRLGGASLSEEAKRDSDLQVLLLDCPGEEACEMTEHPQTGGTQSR